MACKNFNKLPPLTVDNERQHLLWEYKHREWIDGFIAHLTRIQSDYAWLSLELNEGNALLLQYRRQDFVIRFKSFKPDYSSRAALTAEVSLPSLDALRETEMNAPTDHPESVLDPLEIQVESLADAFGLIQRIEMLRHKAPTQYMTPGMPFPMVRLDRISCGPMILRGAV